MNVDEECESEDDYYGSYGSSYGMLMMVVQNIRLQVRKES